MTTIVGASSAPVLVWLEIRGFRAFGTEPRRLDLDVPLSVIHARNSQGKSSLAEALEFLLTGRSSRRDLLGGAKAEYHETLRNVHLSAGDQAVWVAAGLRGIDGHMHEVRRELLRDFAQGTECDSRLLIDGVPQHDLADFGLAPAAGSALGAPVLLQHTLRYVLSTEPKQRVTYFKSLLSLTDLDTLRERVSQARRRLANQSPTPAGRLFTALASTPFREVAALPGATPPPNGDTPTELVEKALLTAGTQALGHLPSDISDLTRELRSAVERQREAVFPLAAFEGAPPPPDVAPVDLSGYVTALVNADRDAAALAPVFAAVLAVPAIAEVSGPADCPVCTTPMTLTPARLDALREELRRGAAVEAAAQSAVQGLRAAADGVARTAQQTLAAVPVAGSWTGEQLHQAQQQMAALELDESLLASAAAAVGHVHAAAGVLGTTAQALRAALDNGIESVNRRKDVDDRALSTALQGLDDALLRLRLARQDSDAAAAALRGAVEPRISARTAGAGLGELLDAVEHAEDLAIELRQAAGRSAANERLANAEKQLAAAAASVLDSRFEQMSDSITRWWLTIRPEELVEFGGVQRRAGGATFVNLMASLRTDATAAPVERHALGVFSDSQLNALGLATFLARTELLSTPLVVLDDPIPGSDGDHRLTFVQNTLGDLLDAGTQVILTTYDDKLADWAATQHAGTERRTFELTLSDHIAGTEPTQTSDVFDQLMLEAEDGLNSPNSKGRRSACNTYRSAAERLAKQIVATARTAAGDTTSVTDVEREAKLLKDLIPLARGFSLDNAEKGNWSTFAKVLNPGSHDDDVPSTAELKQVRGNLRRIVKTHRAYWVGGLVR